MQFEITEPARTAVAAWIACSKRRPEDFLFPSRIHASPHLSTRQYARIVDSWVLQLGLGHANHGTHTLRRNALWRPHGLCTNAESLPFLTWRFDEGSTDCMPAGKQTFPDRRQPVR